MKATYYPGCFLLGTAKEYAESILGICKRLNIHLEEVPDWNCCGATAAHSINHRASIELAGRNLNLAAELPHADMLVPCPMCFNRLKTASFTLQGKQKGRYNIDLHDPIPEIWDLANFFASLNNSLKIIKRPYIHIKIIHNVKPQLDLNARLERQE